MTVTTLFGGEVESDPKRAFIDLVATAFDKYVAAHGRTPEYMVIAAGALDDAQMVAWEVGGESAGRAEAVVARAIFGLQRELLKY